MLVPAEGLFATPPTACPSQTDVDNLQVAIIEARKGLQEGGIPIGGALFAKDGKLLGVGRNRRVQEGSATRHGEIDCLETIGRLPASAYKDCTMYTTLSPCTMCSGAIILFGIKRVVIGENSTFVGGEHFLTAHRVEIINLDSQECKQLMATFIQSKPSVWNEDIGEP